LGSREKTQDAENKMIKQLFSRIRDKFLPSVANKNIEEARQAAAARTFKQPRDLSTYVYLNPGLNRKEKRRLAKMLNTGQVERASALFLRSLTPEARKAYEDAQREQMKWQLKHSPENVPATAARLNDNSMRKRRGEPIGIYTKPSIADKAQKPVTV
jgi:hypothetical protein